jgi:hypothetical protein
MKHTEERPYADPEAAARKLVELAASVEAVQDGRIYIERINAPFLFKLKGSGSEFGAGLKHAIERGWLQLHESGTYVRLLNLKLYPRASCAARRLQNERGRQLRRP